MTTNPFTRDTDALQREFDILSIQLLDWRTKSAWHQSFDLDQANARLRRAERTEADAQSRLQQAKKIASVMETVVNQLEPGASLGIDPRYWFSSARAVAKRQLADAKKTLQLQQASVATIASEASTAATSGRDIHSEISKARNFDPLLAQSAIPALQAKLDRIEPRLAAVRKRRDDLDDTLREPLESLRKQHADRAHLMSQISRAEFFDAELTGASNAYEKRQIHQQCESELGDGKPGAILNRSRGSLRRVDDNIKKLEARADELIRFAGVDIRHVVIDGNNLCYDGKRFLGLAALEALVPILVRSFEVTIIFDASIRRNLEMSREDIEARFPKDVRTHVVASKHKADDTVLSVAGDDHRTFVLSNDRFADYPEKPAVKHKRMLVHDIVGQDVFIHQLRIAAKLVG